MATNTEHTTTDQTPATGDDTTYDVCEHADTAVTAVMVHVATIRCPCNNMKGRDSLPAEVWAQAMSTRYDVASSCVWVLDERMI